MHIIVRVLSLTSQQRASRRFDHPRRLLLPCPQSIGADATTDNVIDDAVANKYA